MPYSINGKMRLEDWKLQGFVPEDVMITHICGSGILDADGMTLAEALKAIESHVCPVLNTKEQNIAFRKDWDARCVEDPEANKKLGL